MPLLFRPRRRTTALFSIAALFLGPIGMRAVSYGVSDAPRAYYQADWSSAGLLPAARDHRPARVMVLTGTTGRWKGIFAVHSWIVVKPADADVWTRYDVVGWGSPVRVNHKSPDGRWYGNSPVVIADLSGPEAGKLIPKIEAAVRDYEYDRHGDYRIWPGPNSNTFTATVLRRVPELGVGLPPNAVGRDYRAGLYGGLTDSGTGVEINLSGLAAFKIGWVEGIEVGLFGLVAGIDLRHPGLKLPGYGRIGLESPVDTAMAH